MNGDRRPVTLNGVIDPEHLLQAICNSLEHSDETTHGVTGICFRELTERGFTRVRHGAGIMWEGIAVLGCEPPPSGDY